MWTFLENFPFVTEERMAILEAQVNKLTLNSSPSKEKKSYHIQI
jgi:hypothetical protein